MTRLSNAFVVFSLILGQTCFSQGYHTIDLQLDLTPYPKSQDIVAQIYVNHKFRTSIPADNTSFSRIYKNIPKQKSDSIIEVKLVLYEPKDYVVIDGVPFTYFSGDRRKVKIIERKLAWGGA